VKTRLTFVVLFLVTGCVTAPSGAARTPSATDIGPFTGGTVATGVARRTAKGLVLDGQVTAGHRIDSGILLGRSPA